jgi:hypothetical protein
MQSEVGGVVEKGTQIYFEFGSHGSSARWKRNSTLFRGATRTGFVPRGSDRS